MNEFIAECSMSVPCKLGATTMVTLVLGGIVLLLLPLADGHLRLRGDLTAEKKEVQKTKSRSARTLNRTFLLVATFLVWIILMQKLWGLFQANS